MAAVFVVGPRSARGLTIEPLSPARLAAAVARHAAFAGAGERREVLRMASGLAAHVPGFLLRAPDRVRAFTQSARALVDDVVRISNGP